MKKLLVILLVVGITFLGCEQIEGISDILAPHTFLEMAVEGGSYYNSTTDGKIIVISGSGTDDNGTSYSSLLMSKYVDNVDHIRLQMLSNTDDTIYEGTFTYNEEYNSSVVDIYDDENGVIMIDRIEGIPRGGIIGVLRLGYTHTDPNGTQDIRFQDYSVIHGDKIPSSIT